MCDAVWSTCIAGLHNQAVNGPSYRVFQGQAATARVLLETSGHTLTNLREHSRLLGMAPRVLTTGTASERKFSCTAWQAAISDMCAPFWSRFQANLVSRGSHSSGAECVPHAFTACSAPGACPVYVCAMTQAACDHSAPDWLDSVFQMARSESGRWHLGC